MLKLIARSRLVLLSAVIAFPLLLPAGTSALADNTGPTPVVPNGPQPTSVAPTPAPAVSPPTVAPEAPTTVSNPRPTPLKPGRVQKPGRRPSHPSGSRNSSGSSGDTSSSGSSGSSGDTSSSGSSGSNDNLLPSAAQLRMDARLRWGTHVPAAVHRWAFLIVPAAWKYHLNPNLIAAVMTMESGGDPWAVSPANAIGLMQVLDGPFGPKANVDMGAHELADDLAEFHNLKLALAAYNAGPGAVIEYGGVPPYQETQDYVVVVSYLFSLYNRENLSYQRKAQYTSSLQDLRRFSNQRRKIPALAKIGLVAKAFPEADLDCHHVNCDPGASEPLFATRDPFWLVGGSPDPLQRVDPAASN